MEKRENWNAQFSLFHCFLVLFLESILEVINRVLLIESYNY